MIGARYEAVMRSAVDGPLIGLLVPPLSPVFILNGHTDMLNEKLVDIEMVETKLISSLT